MSNMKVTYSVHQRYCLVVSGEVTFKKSLSLLFFKVIDIYNELSCLETIS